MAKTTNILAIENDIVTQIETVVGIGTVYREPLADGLTTETISGVDVVVSNSGYTVSTDVAGTPTNQKMTTVWTVALVCKKEDYITVLGPLMVDVLNALKGYRAANWYRPMKIGNDVRNFNKPDIDTRIAYYPLTFTVDIVF